MPISSYGVLLGRLTSFKGETPNNQGKYRHGLFKINVNGQEHTCAVDVDTQAGTVPVHWAVFELRANEWQPFVTRSDGWYALNKTPDDGSADYIRDYRLSSVVRLKLPELMDPHWKWKRRKWFERKIAEIFRFPEIEYLQLNEFNSRESDTANKNASMQLMRLDLKTGFHQIKVRPAWHATQSEEALAALESITNNEPNCRMLFMGSFFNNGLGVHNIHQNQGNFPPAANDPERAAKQRHYESNGIWQDGLAIAIRSNGQMFAFLNKFGVQSDHTDESGNGV
jgi:hypothetical protein